MDFGFGPTFTRLLAYGRGGRSVDELGDLQTVERKEGKAKTDWQTIDQLIGAMQFTYSRLTLLALVFAGGLGPLLLMHPIRQVSHPERAWVAFAVLAVTSVQIIYRRVYDNYLKGMNHVALVNRSTTIIGGLGVVSGILVILLGGRLLALTCSLQFWGLVGAARNRWLAFRVDGGYRATSPSVRSSPAVLSLVRSLAWRSGVGSTVLSTFSQSFNFVIAQFLDPVSIVGYLFASKMLATLRQFALTGFYPKIPMLATLRAAGRVDQQVRQTKRNMIITHWSFVIPVVALAITGPTLFRLVGSKIAFPALSLWVLLALKEQLLRISLMHLHVFQLTNRIIAHKVMWVLGLGQAIACYGLFPWLGVYAFPIGAILGTILPMIWLCRLSYRSMDVNFWGFERDVSLVPVAVIALLAVYGFCAGAVGFGTRAP